MQLPYHYFTISVNDCGGIECNIKYIWGVENLPKYLREPVNMVLYGYENNMQDIHIPKNALSIFKQYIICHVS